MKMIKREFAAIRSNRILMVTLLVVSFLPFLYSIFFLRSVWDPYGHTGNLPVAVVNQDREANFKGKTISAGHDLVNKLKDNHKLKWEFVDKKAANQGMRDKKYFAIITIPSDFSKNATTLLDDNPKKMNLEYESNQSLNYIGNVITEQGAKQLNDKVKTSVTEAYAKAMFAQVEKAGKGFSQAANGSKQLADGSGKLNTGLVQYTNGVNKVGDGVNQLQSGVGPLASGVSQLANGSGQLVNGLGQLQGGVGPLASGVNKLAGGANALSSNLGLLAGKTQALPTQAGKLNSGAQQLAGWLNKLNDPNKGIPSAVVGSQKLQAGLAAMQAGIEKQQGTSGEPKKPTLTDGITGLKAGVAQIQAGIKGATLTEAQQKALVDLQAQVQAINGLAAGIATAAKAVGISDAQTAALMNALKPEFAKVNTAINNDMQQIQPVLNNLPKLGQLGSGVDQLAAGINQLGAGQDQFLATLAEKTGELNAGANGLNGGLSEAGAGLNKLTPGANQLAAGTNTLNASVPTLVGGIGQLATGANQLNGGLGQLNAKVPTLANGVNQLATGANQLNGGLGQLNAKVPTLANGVNQLAAGTKQLTANSGQLVDGAGKLNTGTTKLNNALSTGAKQINAVHFTNKTADMFATPAQVKTTNYSYVPNYGHALAPYVLSLALYVGALVFNFVYPIRRRNDLGTTASGWFFSKVAIGGVVAIAMAIIQYALMYVGGIRSLHPFETLLMLIAFALTSMYVVMFLAMLLDNPGRFLAMVLLMLQLGAAGGTFPMPVTSEFYNAVHWFVPMTYSVLGLRESLTGGLGQAQIGQAIGALMIFVIISLVILWFGMQYLNKKFMKENWAEKIASEKKA